MLFRTERNGDPHFLWRQLSMTMSCSSENTLTYKINRQRSPVTESAGWHKRKQRFACVVLAAAACAGALIAGGFFDRHPYVALDERGPEVRCDSVWTSHKICMFSILESQVHRHRRRDKAADRD